MKCSLCKFKVVGRDHETMKIHISEEHPEVLRGHGLKGQWRGPDQDQVS